MTPYICDERNKEASAFKLFMDHGDFNHPIDIPYHSPHALQ
ncbi:hypothetical protein CCACVL1_00745 [Corchorus capsularis]|uniref:Uncharacterized protein n=1 Tax=Corchorus capsularis TaxID=210143 RepID=A0A1R3KV53_COCAP|nr:hypothetical protein CCACVL1_00745 [Corchorus capsularis]